MKMNQCFKTVFDPELKERGFKRKGILYYRINGEIIQGITIKLSNPYSICFGYIPFWMHGLPSTFYGGCPIDESDWAEEFDYLTGEYYRQDDENAIKYMEKLLSQACTDLIPMLDKVRSNDDYLRMREYYLDPGSRVTRRIIWQYSLMQKALQDRSFAESDRILQKILDYCIASDIARPEEERDEELNELLRKRYYSSALDTLPHLMQPRLKIVEELKKSNSQEYFDYLKGCDRMMEIHYKEYTEIRKKEDFDAIERLYNDNYAKAKEEIRTKLKIDL